MIENFRKVMAPHRLTLQYAEHSPNIYLGVLYPMKIVQEGSSVDELVNKVVDEITLLASTYVEELSMFSSKSPSSDYLPYILNVMVQENKQGVASLIDVQEIRG